MRGARGAARSDLPFHGWCGQFGSGPTSPNALAVTARRSAVVPAMTGTPEIIDWPARHSTQYTTALPR